MRFTSFGREKGHLCKAEYAVEDQEAGAEGADPGRVWERAGVEVLSSSSARLRRAKSCSAAHARGAGEIEEDEVQVELAAGSGQRGPSKRGA